MQTTPSSYLPRSNRKIKPIPRTHCNNRNTDLQGTVKGLYQLYSHSPKLLLSLTNLHARDSSSSSVQANDNRNSTSARRTGRSHRTAPRIIQRTSIITDASRREMDPVDFCEEGNVVSVASSKSEPGAIREAYENTRETFENALHALPSVHLPSWLPPAERPYLEGPALESAAALAAGAEVVFDWETIRDDLSVITNGRALREREEDGEKIGGVVWKGHTVSTTGMPHNSNLLPSERKLCSVLRLKPTQYLTIKHRLLVAAAAFTKSNSFQPVPEGNGEEEEVKATEDFALMTPMTRSPQSSRSRRVSSSSTTNPCTPLPRSQSSSSIANVTPPNSTGKFVETRHHQDRNDLSGSSPPGAGGASGTRAFGKADAQKMCRIDVNKTAKIWEYMRSRNWL